MLLTGGLLFCLSCEKEELREKEDLNIIEETYVLPSGEKLVLSLDSTINSFIEDDQYLKYQDFIDSVPFEKLIVLNNYGNGHNTFELYDSVKNYLELKNSITQKSAAFVSRITVYDDENFSGKSIEFNLSPPGFNNSEFRNIELSDAQCSYPKNRFFPNCRVDLNEKISSIEMVGDTKISFLYELVVRRKKRQMIQTFYHERCIDLNDLGSLPPCNTRRIKLKDLPGNIFIDYGVTQIRYDNSFIKVISASFN